MKTRRLIAALACLTLVVTACDDATDPETDLDTPDTSLVDPGVTEPSLPEEGTLGDG